MTQSEIPEIYLDYAATTPIDPDVRAVMLDCLDGGGAYGNPSSIHVAGRRAHALIETARADVAALINATPRDVVFTSGATEADNLAVIGAARFRAHRGRHVITMTTEHKAVLGAAEALEKEGFEVTRLTPGSDGVLSLADLEQALRDDTQLVSIMHVNNETGVVQDIAAIGSLCRERDVLFHSDAAQSAGRLELDVVGMNIDLLSLSGHKMYAPQGVGALYVASRPGCGVLPRMFGGAQERRLRPGTLPLALIAGFGCAARRAMASRADDLAHLTALSDRLWAAIEDVPGIRRNGSATAHCPSILNVSIADIEGESLMLALEPLCVASGSACNSKSGEASFVLKALGLSDLEAQGAIRFSFGRDTTPADIDAAAAQYRAAVDRLRAMTWPPVAGVA